MTTQTMLDERYGRTRPQRRRRRLWALIVVLAVVAAAILTWFTLTTGANEVRADDVAMSVVDEHSVVVDFQVTGPTDRDIACAVEALDEGFGVVGWLVVEYPATGEHTRAFRETVPTVGEATTGLVNSCWVT